MATSLNVIALVSGGKDSFFSILHCLANGHSIVALANLHPPASNHDEDLNSYMYQTVGHNVIPLYEQALGIPLFRQEILGQAVNSERDYSVPQAGHKVDETESLVPLLETVRKAHPEANAVSTGAILSTYQRTRVESVALRLGLTPLSYLWQYPLLPPYRQSALLHDMAAVGQDARIIKVASGGLDEGFLWANVADNRTITRMGNAIGRFSEDSDGAVLGEGGEFETLAIDGPSVLWKKRIQIESDGVLIQDGGTATWKGKGARVLDKTERYDTGLETLRRPDLLDDEFKSVLDAVATSETQPDTSIQKGSVPTQSTMQLLPLSTINNTPEIFTASNLVGRDRDDAVGDPSSQLQAILLDLGNLLSSHHGLSPSSVAHCTLLLRNMSDFTVLNPIYAQFFNATNPPARVTVAVGDTMPSPFDVMLSIILDKEGPPNHHRRPPRQGLHVQSRSYWAPANIGPYSQAISTPLRPAPASSPPSLEDDSTAHAAEIVYVAGQIPLVPASMDVYVEKGFAGQAVLSLQHLWRIGRAKNVRWWAAGVAYISACPPPEAESRVRTAQAAWRSVHKRLEPGEGDDGDGEDEANHVDPWDLRNRGRVFNDDTRRAGIPDWEAVGRGGGRAPPCFVVQVEGLPRGVGVEWASTGLACGDIGVERRGTGMRVSVTTPRGAASRFCTVEIADGDEDVCAVGELGTWTSCTLYAEPEFPSEFEGAEGVQWVPCKKVWGEDGRRVRGVFVGRMDIEGP